MFGLSWGQIAIIVLVGVFVLGPERIPTAVTWVMTMLRKARTMAAGAQAELRREIGPELDELRRQVADLQSLKEIQELRDLRELHPKRLIGKNILGDEFTGGISGFLGLNGVAPATNGGATTKSPAVTATAAGTAAVAGAAADGATVAGGAAGAAPVSDTPTAAVMAQGAGAGVTPPHLPPSMVKSTRGGGAPASRPRLIGERPVRLASGERPPFDPDGT
jgi:sec-independent protein translocase protein TatB